MGNALALSHVYFSWKIFFLTILTTSLLQILSNIANDYGDFVKGTDNEKRVGPMRTLQSGVITKKQMLIAIIILTFLSFITGIWTIYEGTKDAPAESAIVLLFVGIGAILAAITYTIGKKAYGYSGLGDVFVFIFFGIVGVMGSSYLQSAEILAVNLLPASAIGLLSVGVLNLNNMRDIVNDKVSGKNTIVVKMGLSNAKKYHYFLILCPIFLMLLFSYLTFSSYLDFIYLLVVPILFVHLIKVRKTTIPKELDPELKKVALSTFLISFLFFIGVTLNFLG
jgi:1,4-dihydroxy-2-naphthoate octaprenyltransferase